MNYYPEQLRRIAEMCEALNKIDGEDTPADGVVLASRIEVHHPDDQKEVLGYLVDEVGGAWSFEPVKDGA
jgi:transcription elongation GreA/GreB family factor